jgi:nucleotide-binding universal stress UspA family protein
MSGKYVVLAGIDMNPGSSLVFDRGVQMAGAMPEGELHVLTVTEPRVPVAAYPGMVMPPAPPGVSAEDVAAFCTKRLDELKRDAPAMPLPRVLVHVATGSPADEIVWLAAHLDADGIVVGTHGRRGLRRMLLGSVAEKVVRLAGCPVVIAREKAHNPEWKVPEIEPLCDECASTRASTQGRELWCQRHRDRHVRVHVYGYSVSGEDSPRAWGATTGS